MSDSESPGQSREEIAGQTAGATESSPARPRPSRGALSQVPGIIAIGLYLMLLAVVIVIGVVNRRHYPTGFLLFSVFLFAGSGGLMMLFRWAWALALAAVFLLASYDMWIFSMQHQGIVLVQGLLNVVFFLYLARPEVRDKLR